MNPQRIVLIGLGPTLSGKTWESDNILRIGQEDYLEIVVPHPSVSAFHAEILAGENGWIVRDLDSGLETFLNEVEMDCQGKTLQRGDRIRCGEETFLVADLGEVVRPILKGSGIFMQIRAVVQHSWHRALSSLEQGPKLSQQHQQLLTLFRTGFHLSQLASTEQFLQSVLDDVVSVLDAQRGCILLAEGEELNLRTVSLARHKGCTNPAHSRTLATRSFERGESLLCQDVTADVQPQAAMSSLLKNMSSVICVLLRSPRRKLGVLHLDRGPLHEPFTETDFHLADAIGASISLGLESAQLAESQRQLFLQTITALARAVEFRDQYTGDHTQRVTDYALLLAEELRLSTEDKEHIRFGAPVHDIGKIAIEDRVLRKPGRLTAEEFELMKSHTVKGVAMLQDIPGLTALLPIIRNHHERWDGSGYPDGLSRDNIPLLARLVAVPDAFDAMTSRRPYREAIAVDQAFAEIQKSAGTHFDPVCAQAFLRLRPRIEQWHQENCG